MEAIVPLHLNKSDLDRTETMLGLMHHLQEQGEIRTQVLFVVWNCVKSCCWRVSANIILTIEPVHLGN